jgi:rhomboid protease GluP
MNLIYRAFQAQNVAERALVLRAMDIEHEIRRGVLGWVILVPEHEAERALEQWRLYELENRKPPPPDPLTAARPGVGAGAMGWFLILFGFAYLQTRYAFGIDWLDAGRLEVASVRDGEWWRAVTALTLHSNSVHLLVNVGFGAVFGSLLAREVGGGLAWLLILTGGAAGNLMNCAVQRPGHMAIGASTAVFAALGLLSAYLWIGKRMIRDTWARRLSPLVGGVILLAWLGTGDERTDIVAHLTGFIAGIAMGVVLGRLPRLGKPDVGRQTVLAAAAVLSVGLAWVLAIKAGGPG